MGSFQHYIPDVPLPDETPEYSARIRELSPNRWEWIAYVRGTRIAGSVKYTEIEARADAIAALEQHKAQEEREKTYKDYIITL